MRVPVKITPSTQRAAGGIPFVRGGGNAGTQSQANLGNSLIQAGNTLGSVGGLLQEQAKQARRFGMLQNFSTFETTVTERMAELKRGADPALGNFADQATANYANWEDEWLKEVPDEFYDEFKTHAATIKANVARDALAFQYERTDAYFRQGVSDSLNLSLLALDQDGSLENLDRQRAQMDEKINTTTLSEAEKVALRRSSYSNIEKAVYKKELVREQLEAAATGAGSVSATASDLIMEFSGGDLENDLTYEANVALVQERVAEAEAAAIAGIGDTGTWQALPKRAQAAIISLVDDLGGLPELVKEAIDSGDLATVATAVSALGDGEGRREQEANLILGTTDIQERRLDADPRFANISYEDRLALRADADAVAAAQQAAEQKAAKAAQDAAINNLKVNLFDGNAGQMEIDQAREEGWLTDYTDIAAAQKLLEDRNGGIAMTQRMQQMLQMGMTINPASDDDRKMFNAYIGKEGEAALRSRDPDYVTNVLVPAVRTAGDLPTEATGLLTAMTRSQDPAQALYAFDTLSQLQQASPEAYDARVSEAMASDVEYWRQVKDFYPADMVLDTIRGGTTQEGRVRTQMLREEARTMLKKDEAPKVSIAELGDAAGWRLGDPTMAVGTENLLTTDFNTIFEREYGRDGDAGKARDRTMVALSKIWKVSDVGGSQMLMKYPPEAVGYQKVDGKYDWLTQQGREVLGLADNQNFQLISDEQTRNEFQSWQVGGAEAPSYLVVYTNEEGQLDYPKDDTGMPMRMNFEMTPEVQAEKEASFNRRQVQGVYENFMTTYNRAKLHSLQTGVPIPQELHDEADAWQTRVDAGEVKEVFNQFGVQ